MIPYRDCNKIFFFFVSILPFSAVLGDGYGGHSSSGIGTACIVKVQSIKDMVAAAMETVLAVFEQRVKSR